MKSNEYINQYRRGLMYKDQQGRPWVCDGVNARASKALVRLYNEREKQADWVSMAFLDTRLTRIKGRFEYGV